MISNVFLLLQPSAPTEDPFLPCAGAGIGVHTPVKQPPDGRELAIDNRAYNMLLRSLRSLGERGFALLSQRWRVLQHITASPEKIGAIANAALVLTHFEYKYLPC